MRPAAKLPRTAGQTDRLRPVAGRHNQRLKDLRLAFRRAELKMCIRDRPGSMPTELLTELPTEVLPINPLFEFSNLSAAPEMEQT